MKYVLSNAAKTDLKNIYKFGYERFGEQQADRYFDGLLACFEEITKDPLIFPQLPELGNYRRCVYISESMYYRVAKNRVEIMAIIGRQDTSTRLLR